MTKELNVEKNTSKVYDFYTKTFLPKNAKNKTVLLIELGNTKYIREIKKYAKDVLIIDSDYDPFSKNGFVDINSLEKQIETFLENNKMSKFDVAIMNPPYGGICKEIYEFLYDKKPVKELIAINPAQYWEFLPYLIDENHKEIFFDYLKSIEIINHSEFCDTFDIGNAVTGNGAIIKMNYLNKNTAKEIKKHYNKFISSNVVSVLTDFKSNLKKTIVAVKGVEKNKTQKTWVANYKKYIEYGNYVKIYTWHNADNPKDMIICPDDGNGKSIIGTKTKKELKNFINSLNTWPYYFAYHLTQTDNAKMLSYCPWMEDYSNEWNEERFCEYFFGEDKGGYISDDKAKPGSKWETVLNIINLYK